MNEQQRQQYLGAMDIQPWFPRYALPEAKPSSICEWDCGICPEENQQAATELQSVTEPTSPAPFVPLDKPVMRPSDIMGKVTRTKPENIAETTPVKASPAQLAERFRLVTLSINTDCLIVSELPSTGMNQFTHFHERLVRNLLFSVGISVEPDLYPALFDWPIVGNRMDQNEQAAYEAVHGYLTNQFGLRRRKILFLLGRNCVRYTLGRDVDFDDLCGVSTDDHQIRVVSHSLDALMKLPALKADTWRDISPLLTHT
ncbi:MAG: hypothetical protein KAG53_11375 [Endozoicomonadaceae bacterium]|nr:hypothetical protein [Endozoicomonadaceae bacterium]